MKDVCEHVYVNEGGWGGVKACSFMNVSYEDVFFACINFPHEKMKYKIEAWLTCLPGTYFVFFAFHSFQYLLFIYGHGTVCVTHLLPGLFQL